MANSIAKASFILTAEGGGLNSSLDKAGKDIQKFSKDASKRTEVLSKEDVGKGIADKIGGAGGIAGQLVSLASAAGPVGIAVVAALGGIAVAVGAVVAAGVILKGIFDEMSEKISKTAKEARELGVDLKGFGALQYAAKIAGVEVGDLQGALTQLKTNLIAADAPANRIFGQLGLNVEELRRLPVDEAMAKIAGALNAINNPAERARIALQIFGDKAVGIQTLLDKGAGGIKELADEARKAGITFDEVDAAKIRTANEALARLGTSIEGIKTQLAIWMAPFVEGIAEAIKSWGGLKDELGSGESTFSTIADVATKALQGIAVAVAYMWDAWKAYASWVATNIDAPLLRWYGTVSDIITNVTELITEELGPVWEGIVEGWNTALEAASGVLDYLKGLWTDVSSTVINAITSIREAIINGLRNALASVGIDADAAFKKAGEVVGWFLSKIKYLGDAIKKLWERITRKSSTGDTFREAADSVEKLGETLGKGKFGDSAKSVNEFFDNIRTRNKQVTEEVAKTNPIDSIRAKVLQGINQLEAELRKSIATIGFTGPESKIFELQQQGANPEQLATVKELAAQAKNVEAAWGTIQLPPFDMWERQLAGLDQMLADGRISWEQYAGGINTASKQLIQAAGLGEIKTINAQLKGSSAATSSIIKAELQDRVQNDPAAELRRAIIEAKEIQKKQLEVTKEMLKELQKNNDEDEVF